MRCWPRRPNSSSSPAISSTPPQTGPRGPLFLCEQFARLAQRQIPVYWAGGGVDPPEVWPAFIPLPDNVHLSARGRVAELVHQRDGAPLARVLLHGRDGNRLVRAGDFNPDPAGLYTIAVVHGTVETAALGVRGIDYWALGGRHDRSTLFSAPQMAHYAGQPARPAARRGRRPRLHAGPGRREPPGADPPGADRRGPLAQRAGGGRRGDQPRRPGIAACAQRMHALLEATPKHRPAGLLDRRRQRAADRAVAARQAGRRVARHAAERARAWLAGGLERVDGGRAGGRTAAGVVRARDDPRRFPPRDPPVRGEPRTSRWDWKRTCPRPTWPAPWPRPPPWPTRRSARPCSATRPGWASICSSGEEVQS